VSAIPACIPGDVGAPQPPVLAWLALGAFTQDDAYFREVLGALPAAVYMTDAAGRLTYFNEAAAKLWGRTPELGTSQWCGYWKLFWPDGRSMPYEQCPMAIAVKEKRPIRGMEAVAERPDGTRVPFIPFPTPLYDASGALVGAVNMLVDISERKFAEEVLQKQTRRLETLNRVAKAISSDLELERIVQTVTDSATELCGAKFGAFFYNLIDDHGERYTLYALSGASRAAFEKCGLPRNTAVFDPTFRGSGIVRSGDIRSDPRYGLNAPHYGMPEGHLPIVSYLAVPVVSRTGEVHGGLFFGHDKPCVFTRDSEEIAGAIAAHAAVAIDNARLLQARQSEVEQLRQAEQAAQRLAAIVESSDDAILTKDLNGTITSWNQGAERLFGYTDEEVIGKPVTILMPADRHDEEPAILARIQRGERIHHYETIRQRKDGSFVEISLTVSPVRNQKGEIVGASKVARDITERRRAQEQQRLLLREMDHRVKNLFSLARSVVSLSARSAKTPKELASDAGERLGALARAHALTLTKPSDHATHAGQSTTLHALIRTIVSPYDAPTGGSRTGVMITGPDLPLSGGLITSFALLLHEFTTNAAKYGALSVPTGDVHIQCSESNGHFSMTWKENGGPRIEHKIENEGFGSLLARRTVKDQLGGEISHDWDPEGLTIHLSIARDRLPG
jgi:PAS domain S-box-containing protein